MAGIWYVMAMLMAVVAVCVAKDIYDRRNRR